MPNKFKIGDRVKFTQEARDTIRTQKTGDTIRVVTRLINDGVVNLDNGLVPWSTEWLVKVRPDPPSLISSDKIYQTRSGVKVLRIICTDAPGKEPVVAALEIDGQIGIRTFHADGRYAPGAPSPWDLVEIPPKPKEWEVWVNFRESYAGAVTAVVHSSEDDSSIVKNRLCQLHLKIRDDGTSELLGSTK